MTMLCCKNAKLIMTTACYKDAKSMMTNLIIIKIRFIYFKEDKICESCVKSYARSRASSYARSYTRSCNHNFCDHGVIDISNDHNCFCIYLVNFL